MLLLCVAEVVTQGQSATRLVSEGGLREALTNHYCLIFLVDYAKGLLKRESTGAAGGRQMHCN